MWNWAEPLPNVTLEFTLRQGKERQVNRETTVEGRGEEIGRLKEVLGSDQQCTTNRGQEFMRLPGVWWVVFLCHTITEVSLRGGNVCSLNPVSLGSNSQAKDMLWFHLIAHWPLWKHRSPGLTQHFPRGAHIVLNPRTESLRPVNVAT